MGCHGGCCRNKVRRRSIWPGVLIVIGIMALLMVCRLGCAAESIDVTRLVDAIYKAEGGAKAEHPYGIMKRYKHTTPRQACINTIKHKYQDWIAAGSHGDYFEYLASKYAPINCDTDNGTNQYWLKNVRYWYKRT